MDGLLRRYDPGVRRRFGTYVLSNGARVRRRKVQGDERLARGLKHHLEGLAGEPEALEDLVRVFIPGRLLPAELASLLPFDVMIREDTELELFWFENDDPDLTVCAHEAKDIPLILKELKEKDEAYVCGIDAPHEPSKETIQRAWTIADTITKQVGGVVVDRYGFQARKPEDLV